MSDSPARPNRPRPRLKWIGGQDADQRLLQQIQQEARLHPGHPVPDDCQIAMVLHALADHTSIMHGLGFDPDAMSPWPLATSYGRFLHAYGDLFTDRALATHTGKDDSQKAE